MNVQIELIYYTPLEDSDPHTYIIESNKVIECNWSSNILDSDLSITPGICEQYAEIRIYDKFLSELVETSADALLNPPSVSSTNISIYLTDLNGATKIMSLFISDLDVDMDNDIVKIYARDPSYIFKNDEFIIPASPISGTGNSGYSVEDLFNYIQNYVPYNFQCANTFVKTFTQTLKFPMGFLKQDNLYNMLMDICNVAMLRIYWTKDDVFLIDEVLI